jgi:hypothetical protein
MCAQGTCTCGCGGRRANAVAAMREERPAFDLLDDVADWGSDDGLDAFTPRAAAPRNLGFVLNCPSAQRRQRFRAALRLAIALAREAAAKLTAPSLDTQTRNLFIHFFGTQPDRRPPWAAPRTAAQLVAHRYTMVARELAGGRRFRYTCQAGAVGACEPSQPGNVVIAATTAKSAITLCDHFFDGRRVDQMAGTIIHEGMHAVYWDLFDHSVPRGIPSRPHRDGTAECRRDNARCFQGFALRLRGFGAEADIRDGCRRTPAQCRRLVRA